MGKQPIKLGVHMAEDRREASGTGVLIMIIENRQVKVGDEVRVGMQLMTVDEVTEFDTVIVIDQDGEELELTENEIDIY